MDDRDSWHFSQSLNLAKENGLNDEQVDDLVYSEDVNTSGFWSYVGQCLD